MILAALPGESDHGWELAVEETLGSIMYAFSRMGPDYNIRSYLAPPTLAAASFNHACQQTLAGSLRSSRTARLSSRSVPGLPGLGRSGIKAVANRSRRLAAALVVLALLSVIAWMNRYRLFPSGLWQPDVEMVLEGYEFDPGALRGNAKVTLRNHTDRKISFPTLRDNERPVAAVLSTTRKGAEWNAPAWDETAKDEVFMDREAEAGGSVQLLIPLKAGAAPKRIALLCTGMPDSALTRLKRAFGAALGRIGIGNKLQILPAGYGQEVWCSHELSLPSGKVE